MSVQPPNPHPSRIKDLWGVRQRGTGSGNMYKQPKRSKRKKKSIKNNFVVFFLLIKAGALAVVVLA
jgi:hypothetical protein